MPKNKPARPKMSSMFEGRTPHAPAKPARRKGSPPHGPAAATDPRRWFKDMISHCLSYARAAKAEGRPVVGIMCEYTPRELILAAGGVPVCLCGGEAGTIPAAEKHLPSNLCPLIKSTYGYLVEGSNPFLEMADLVVAETTCDGKKKMFELMSAARPMHVLELPHKEDNPDALGRWTAELHAFRRALEKRFGVEISEAKVRAAIRTMNEERRLRRELARLMAREAPPLTGRELLDFKSIISGQEADLAAYRAALDRFGSDGGRRRLAGRTRVLVTGVPMVHGAERVMDIIEGSGGLVVALESCTGLKPIRDDVDEGLADPIEALARKYFSLPCSVKTPNAGRPDLLRALVREFRPEAVIELVWQACLTYDVESAHIRRLSEDELGLPYLRIETDYSPSDSSRIALRVEALCETVVERKRRASGERRA